MDINNTAPQVVNSERVVVPEEDRIVNNATRDAFEDNKPRVRFDNEA